ncbi:hypothetical protein INT45_004443 [Circinella minor]|uniref:BTB domain-containing protein n=1 Tax=Circinella minor TaxID=1195481 RepID=A0A8H7S1U2_9FUNG|nr:hypothetical protein INT45_004443 [Circinella minor]
MKRVNSHSFVERHVASMFDNSLFADLSLGFIHPSYPFTMRFEVHKSVVSQSSFFKNLICNMQYLPTQENAIENNNSTSNDYDETSQSNVLTIHLARALSHCGFVLAPFQHIIRRKWQKAQSKSTTVVQQQSSSSSSNVSAVKPLGHHILASHIRFALRWMYIYDRQQMIQSLEDDDTLRVLAIAILFDLDDLATACVNKYINEQLCMTTIMRDLEHICQLPRDHHAYLQLRDASLLLLLRYGADEPENLSDLPVDYMADVLSADMLFVGCEYDRYFLIREVLSMFMRSVGKITWTRSGPVDQDRKRLSGFVRPAPITSSVVRSRKRKRIPSEELLSTSSATDHHRRATKMARLSFSATVPFESLVADASSGGIIDKATVLSHLLKTTVNYSNMTFDQLTKVRQDGIVDDDIVFRALWQREAFERLLLPTRLNKTDSSDDDDDDDEKDQVDGEERQEALDDYFDVGSGASDDRRRQLLLGTPKYRFCMSVELSSPSHENGWICDACDICNTGSPSPPMSLIEKEGYNDNDNNEMDIEQEEYSIQPSSQQQLSLKEQQKRNQNNEDGLDIKEGEEIEETINLNEDDDDDEDEDDEIGDRKVGELAVAISSSPSPKTPQQPVRLTPTSTMLDDLSLASQSKFRDEPNQQHDDIEQRRPSSSKKHDQHIIWQKKFYSQPEMIWGTTYRVQIEAQVVPNHLLHIEEDDDGDSYDNSNNDNSTESENHKHKSSLLCRFELQRSGLPLQQQQQHNNNEDDDASLFLSVTHREKSHLSILSKLPSEGVSSSQPTTLHYQTGSTIQQQQRLPVLRRRCSAPSQFISSMTPKQPRIRYTIHCLNQREGVIENDRVDPEDRILLPVTDQTEGEDRNVTGYVSQVQIDGYHPQELTKIDTVICLEVFGFNRTVQ